MSSDAVWAALREGAQMILDNEDIDEIAMMDWQYRRADVLTGAAVAAIFNVDDMTDPELYAAIYVLATHGDGYWDLFREAYCYGSEIGSMMGYWAMESTNKSRLTQDLTWDAFFAALAVYAERQFERDGGQLTLF